MGVCYIVGAGEGFVPFSVSEGDLVIAADGGCRYLAAHGILPHVVIGDMDSCDTLPMGVPLLRHPVRKDDTDMGLALHYALSRGYRTLVMLGALGGREDHTFANYHLLFDAKQQGADVRIVSENTEVRCIQNEEVTFRGHEGDTLSVFAYGGEAHGVTLRGTSYSLSNGTLTPAFPLGVSNAFVGERVTVCVRDGALLCFHVHAKIGNI